MVFDIGGTYIRYNILNEHLDLLEDISANKYRSPSFHRHPNFSGDELVSALIDQITKSFENIKKRNGALNVGGIGISFPGPVNSKGTVRSAPPLWGDIIKNYPKMVYVSSINPREIKGPHIHTKRTSHFVCIHGKVLFIVKNNDGTYSEIESSGEHPVLIHIPKNIASAHINLSTDTSRVLALADISWKPNDNEMINTIFDDYDWKKWI